MPKGRVLAVDDQRYFRELIEGLLSEEGYDVQTADSGEEALRILERSVFDIVVTDLVMPVMNGSDLVHRIKERDPDQYVVVVTGVVDVKSAVDAMKIGADDYLLKPFDRRTLCQSLETLLGRRSLQRERDRLLAENIEFLGERSLFERALGLFGSLSIEVLAQKILEGLTAETNAQGGVLWLDEEETGGKGPLRLFAARGLVRVAEERATLPPGELPAEVRGGQASSALVDWEERGVARRSLVVVLRRGSRVAALARLTDKLGGDGFDDVDRACAEKFAQFGERALANAERFRALERRSLQDPETGAYRIEYLADVARNEIERANRFGRTFGLVKLTVEPADRLRARLGEQPFERFFQGLARAAQRVLRATDLLAVDEDHALWMLLAESDAIGAATFKRRTAIALEACEALAPLPAGLGVALLMSSATYPADATQLESLRRVLDERIASQKRLGARLELLEQESLSDCLHALLEEGSPEPAESAESLIRFALGEVGRRPRERNLFFFHPGARFAATLDDFDTVRASAHGTEVAVLSDAPRPRHGEEGVSWLPAARLGGCPPFLVHYGNGPAYALVCDERDGDDGPLLYHSADSALAEVLAFRLQRELRLPALG